MCLPPSSKAILSPSWSSLWQVLSVSWSLGKVNWLLFIHVTIIPNIIQEPSNQPDIADHCEISKRKRWRKERWKRGGRRTVNLFFRLLMKRSETSWLLENINEQSLYCSLSIYHSLFLYLVLSDCVSPSLTLSLSLFCLPVFSLFIFTFINIALIMNPFIDVSI